MVSAVPWVTSSGGASRPVPGVFCENRSFQGGTSVGSSLAKPRFEGQDRGGLGDLLVVGEDAALGDLLDKGHGHRLEHLVELRARVDVAPRDHGIGGQQLARGAVEVALEQLGQLRRRSGGRDPDEVELGRVVRCQLAREQRRVTSLGVAPDRDLLAGARLRQPLRGRARCRAQPAPRWRRRGTDGSLAFRARGSRWPSPRSRLAPGRPSKGCGRRARRRRRRWTARRPERSRSCRGPTPRRVDHRPARRPNGAKMPPLTAMGSPSIPVER